MTWVDREPGFSDALRELARLGRRAVAHPFAVVFLAALATALLVGWRARKAIHYTSRIVLRVVENDQSPDMAPRPKAKFREYVNDVVFTGKNLLAIMEKHDLYGPERRRDPTQALESFKDEITVVVYRNYFLEERYGPDAPLRSARISIRYRAQSPQVALDVTRELADLVVRFESESRRERIESAMRVATQVVADARRELTDRQQELTAKRLEPETARTKIELAKVLALVHAAERRAADAERARGLIETTAAAERQDMQLRFEVVDPGSPAPIIKRGPQLVALGILGFLLGVPFLGVAIGAFDPRVRDIDDVRRLGIPSLGRVPAYAGDDAGSLEDRRHAEPAS